VNALAHSRKRIWSASNRVPHLTGWGTSGSHWLKETSLLRWIHDRFLELVEVAQRTAPIAMAFALNLFR
jgi:hypothetical protein